MGEGLIDEWAKDMKEIAQNQNVFCKLSGMVTETGDIEFTEETQSKLTEFVKMRFS